MASSMLIGLCRRTARTVLSSSPSDFPTSYSSGRLRAAGCLSPLRRSMHSHEIEELATPASLISSPAPLLMFPPEGSFTGVQTSVQRHNTVGYVLISIAQRKLMKLKDRRVPEEISSANWKGSSNGWILYVDPRDCGLYLANLFSSSPTPQIIPLPSVETLRPVLQFGRDPSSKLFNHYAVYDRYSDTTLLQTPSALSDHVIGRFAMSSTPDKDDCTVMISHNQACDLAFCKIGDPRWTHLADLKQDCMVETGSNCHVDIVYSRKEKKFYSINHDGLLRRWDLSNPEHITKDKYDDFWIYMPAAVDKALDSVPYYRFFLVESTTGDILWVERCYESVKNGQRTVPAYRTAGFKVYRMDFKSQTGRRLESLGDMALFLGMNESICVSTKEYPSLKPNVIWFCDNSYDQLLQDHGAYGGHDFGGYILEEDEVRSPYSHFEPVKLKSPPLWVFPRTT